MLTQAFNIALPRELVRRVDLVAKNEYRNRSELIREAVRVYLEDKLRWSALFRTGERAARRLGLTSEADVDAAVTRFRHGHAAS